MPYSDDELFAIARRAAQAFRDLPNVHAVGLGGRERGGRPTGEIVLKVLVREKVPADQLEAGARVPPFFEGLPTDVIRVGVPRPNALVPGFRPATREEWNEIFDDSRYRPLMGGTALLSDLQDAAGGRSMGTLGLIVEALGDDRMVFALTNHHVLFEILGSGPDHRPLEIPGTAAGQPSTKRSCTACCRGVIGKYFGGRGILVGDAGDEPNVVDYALVRLDPGLEWLNEIKEIGVVQDFYALKVDDVRNLDYQVRKRGAATRLTGGIVHVIGIAHPPSVLGHPDDFFYAGSIAIRPNPSSGGELALFSRKGDSGSALMNDDGKVVGLLWGSVDEHTSTDPAQDKFLYAFGVPIQWILDHARTRLGVTLRVLPTAGEGIVNRVPEFAGASEIPRAEASLERDLDRTERGRLFLEAWLRHSDELNAIVQNQRRVATVWQRHNGSALLRLVARAPLEPSEPLPSHVDGVPVREGLALFLDQVERYASDELRHDLARHRPLVLSLPGRSYEQVLDDLQGPVA